MPQSLRLEYVCTSAEMVEAESLTVRQHVGKGSKWRTHLIIFGMLSVALLLLYFQIRIMVPAAYIPYTFAAIIVAIAVFVLGRRHQKRARKHATNRIDVNSTDLTILGAGSKVTFRWSAFGECLESPNLFVLVDRPKGMIVVLPKRAFPDEGWQNWFRERTSHLPPSAPQPSLDAPVQISPSSPHEITLSFRLAYRDYLGLALASASVWGMILALEGILVGTFLYAAAHPPPHPVISSTWIFFMVVLPFMAVLAVMCLLITSIKTWRAHTKYLAPQGLSLGEESIHFAGPDGTGVLPWTTYACFKETRWGFIVWKGWRSVWLLLPKRSFASAGDVQRCRELLSRHLRPSRWFSG